MEFDELVEHLVDLTELTRSEGFIALADQLERFRIAVRYNRGAFDARVLSTPPAAADADAERRFSTPQSRAGLPSSIND